MNSSLGKCLPLFLFLIISVSCSGLNTAGKDSCDNKEDCLEDYQCVNNKCIKQDAISDNDLESTTSDGGIQFDTIKSNDDSSKSRCEQTPAWGECYGDIAAFCDNRKEKTINCSTVWPGTSATCEQLVNNQPTPLTCRVKTGNKCLVEISGASTHLPCAGSSPGCMVDSQGGIACQQNMTPCSHSDVGTCRGNNAVLNCTESQPLQFDCDWMTCKNGVCKGLAIGVACVPGLLECEDGAVCKNQGGGSYLCVPGGNDCPSGCTSPPNDKCQWNYGTASGVYTAIHYKTPGTCNSPPTDNCLWSTSTSVCKEDCKNGVCVPGATCTLSGGCTSSLGCKRVSSNELRCIPVDNVPEKFPCSDVTPGYRCGSNMECVWPSFETTSVCAYLCKNNNDCAGVGLLNEHVCVPIPGTIFGWCR